jgi:hypothetical protein
MKEKLKKYKIPEHTLDEAIKAVVTAHKSAFTNLAKGNIKYFRIRYKKDKSARVSLKLEGTCFPNGQLPSKNNHDKHELFNLESLFNSQYPKYKTNNTFCSSVFGKNIASSEPFYENERTSTILWNKRTNRFFLQIPIDKKVQEPLLLDTKDICAIDPGIRTFATVYGTKAIYQIGENYQEMVAKEFKKMDNLECKIETQQNPKDLRKMKKRVKIIQQKIENRVDDMHFKASKLLCTNFRTILLGKLSTKSICSKKNNLNKKTKRECYALKHFSFRQKLVDKSEYLSSKLNLVSEHYTSRTCCFCRKRNDASSKEIFTCQFCKSKINRDVQGAYNIFYKHFDLVDKDFKNIK